MAPQIVQLASLDDERLADFANLRDRDLQRRQCFIAESEVVLKVLIERRTHPVRAVLLAAGKVDRLMPLLSQLPDGVPVFAAEQGLLDAITGFHIHRGVLASAERTPVADAESFLRALPASAHTLVVTEGLTNHDNVGGVFRCAAALGADGVLLDDATCDPLYRKAIRVSVGGALVVPYARCRSVRELLPLLQKHGFFTIALTPSDSARDIRRFRADRPAKVALLLGSEGPGLIPDTLAATDARVCIPQAADFDSLNVATACAIALHELVPR